MKQKKDFNCKFGARVAALRTKQKLSRERLSEQAEISDRFLYDIESGRKGCSAENLLHLSRALGVSANYLLTGEIEGDQPQFASLIELLSAVPIEALPYVERLLAIFGEYSANHQQQPFSKL